MRAPSQDSVRVTALGPSSSTPGNEMLRTWVRSDVEAQISLRHLQTLASSVYFLHLPTFSTLEAQSPNKLYLETA